VLPRPRCAGAAGRGARLGAGLLAMAALVAVLCARAARTPAVRPVEARFETLTSEAGVETSELSPDGEFFVYAKSPGDLDIFWHAPARHPQNLTEDAPGRDTQPALSPTSSGSPSAPSAKGRLF